MQRYFIDKEKDHIELNQEQIHHIIKVMRMNIHDKIEIVFKEKGYIYQISSLQPFEIDFVEELSDNPELNVDLTLLYCLPKGDKLDLVIQKATEIGVKEIILVQSSRCISKFSMTDFLRKKDRFDKIAIEASEQSHRFIVPKINQLISFKDINKLKFDYAYIAYEKEGSGSFLDDIKNIKKDDKVGILIGCEGGFSSSEVEYAVANGYKSISLGKRILRSETACFYALSVLSYLLEDK